MTMNLIQQQTAAKDLPLQYLQSAVNGQNPNLTPWIATAELQRRTTMDQHMQQGPQGPMPTVKDQVEQKAGLLAAPQAQGMQPGQAPQGMPQGQAPQQPQAQAPVMAARGGLMDAHSNLKFARGGILGFAGDEAQGSSVPDANAQQLSSDRGAVVEGLKKFGYAAEDIAAMPFRAASALLNTLVVRPTRAITGADIPYFPLMGGEPGSVSPYTDAAFKAAHPQGAAAQKTSAQGPNQNPEEVARLLRQNDLLASAPPAVPAQRAPAGNPLADAAAAMGSKIPNAPSRVMPTDPEGMAAAKAGLAKFQNAAGPDTTLEGAMAQQDALAKRYHTDQPIGTEERAMLAKQQAMYDAYNKNERPYSDFARWAAGTIGVPGTAGLQLAEAKQQNMANDLAQQQNQYKALNALNTAQREANLGQQAGAASTLSHNQTLAANLINEQGKVNGQVYDALMRDAQSKYATDSTNSYNLQIAKIHAAATTSAQAQAALMGMQKGVDDDIHAYSTMLLGLQKTNGSDDPQTRAVQGYLEAAQRTKANLLEKAGLKSGVATAPPPPSNVLRYDAKGNRIQ
ncbi:hypothetical protein UFOVP48_56 [uncultured Caudovirales phage]|uniref:Uncharacterized protein n=1 Tax=uncultured Caudovirales phage TaxID=2100421 RepID=A0A6J5KRX9_9CAUD|nr:hypothetical protein UFOVP48_56 [uncultured Caudovirales phage]